MKLAIAAYEVAELEAVLVHDKFTQGRFQQSLHVLNIGVSSRNQVPARDGLLVALLSWLTQWSPLEWSSQLLIAQTLRPDSDAAVEPAYGESWHGPEFRLVFADFEWFSWTGPRAAFYHVVTFEKREQLPRTPISSWQIDLRGLSCHLNRQIQRLRGKDAVPQLDPSAAG